MKIRLVPVIFNAGGGNICRQSSLSIIIGLLLTILFRVP
jgi:hypothetical protein